MTTQALPPVTPDFQRMFRAVALAIGYKNAAKQVAYGPTAAAAPQVVYATPKARRNGRHKEYTLVWWDVDGRRWTREYRADREATAWGHACALAQSLDATRFERAIPCPFTPARRQGGIGLNKTDVRLALYEPKECCGQPMGLMETWSGFGSGSNKVEAIYQCAVNAKHTKPAALKAASPAGK